ncbi:MAG: ATPase [Spirochaetales bacterium]|nr:ATPase [Spirochaetales bacterium]MBR1583128.1 ATPase [Spirochaetales bacterium]
MIEKMKKIIVVAPQEKKASLLAGIRDLGVIHISEKASPDAALSARLSELSKIRSTLAEMPKTEQKEAISGVAFESVHNSLVAAIEEKRRISDELVKMKVERESLAKWGDFNPEDLRMLCDKGLELSFYLLGKKEVDALDEQVRYISLRSIDKQCAIAVVGELPQSYSSSRFVLPQKGLSQVDAEIASKTARVAELETVLNQSACYIASYDKAIASLTDEIVYNSVDRGASTEEGLSLLCGFIPESDLSAFKDKAKAGSWAYALDDPTEEDPVPTKVRYNKVTKMMKPLFDMLGTVPGYREYDISMWFLLFLSLFFGMIIGDAAYGAIFLALGVVLNIKTKKCSNLNLLLYVMSIATVVWGSLTGTWFGSEKAMEIPLLKALVIPSIANYPQYFGVDSGAAQNALMKFCFAVGTIQLSLACIMNVIRKWKEKSLALVADFAWLAMIISIYFLALMLVIGDPVNVKIIFAVIIGGLLTVIVFGGQAPGQSFGKGLKAGLGGAFTTFLNTISAFGNVMSYIRLFAVGMASLAIAQSFNGMASPMLKGWAFPAGMLILFIGHALNIVMGLLSVVVHGVRLNLLEFSGQLGMEWAGIPYEPFRKNA